MHQDVLGRSYSRYLELVERYLGKNPNHSNVVLNYFEKWVEGDQNDLERPLYSPELTVFDSIPGISRVGDIIASGWPAVVDFGATFGTAFLPQIREQVAIARKEKSPLETVSIVCTLTSAKKWIDIDRLHPLIKNREIDELRRLEYLTFIRLPANQQAVEELGQFHISSKNEIQLFLVPDTDLLMKYLIEKHQVESIAVRSSNISGEPEETKPLGAIAYATVIGSPVLAILSKNIKNFTRKSRIGSQPIIRLPTKEDASDIQLVRAGNTHPQLIKWFIKDIYRDVGFIHKEEKHGVKRKRYHPLTTDLKLALIPYLFFPGLKNAKKIKSEVLKASNLL